MFDSVQPHRRQPTRLPRPWDSPGKNTGVSCRFLLQCMKGKVKVKSLSRVRLFVTPWTSAYQAPPSMGFSRQEYWSGVPLPSGDPFQGPKLGSCLTLGNELSEETHVLTKQEILLGKGTWVESSRVKEPGRTTLPRGLQSRVLW